MQRQFNPDYEIVEVKILVPYKALGAVYGRESLTITRFRSYGCDVNIDRNVSVEIAPNERVCTVRGNIVTVLGILIEIVKKVYFKLTREFNQASDMVDMIRREEVKLLVTANDISKMVRKTGKTVQEIIGEGAEISISPKPGSLEEKTSRQRVITIKYDMDMNFVWMGAIEKIVRIIGCQGGSQAASDEESFEQFFEESSEDSSELSFGEYLQETSTESCEEVAEESFEKFFDESSDEFTEESLSGAESNTEEQQENPVHYAIHSLCLATPKKTTTPCGTVILTPRALRFGVAMSPSVKCENPIIRKEVELDFKIFEELTMVAVFGC